MLIELLYTSQASAPMDDDALLELLETSRRNNDRTGITGMLLFHKGSFLQLLEGEEQAVMALYQSILEDERHSGSRVVWKGPIPARSFPEWTMAFRTLGDVDPARLVGYSDLVQRGFAGPFLGENPSAAQSLMRMLSELD